MLEKVKRVLSILLVITMVVGTNGMTTLAGTIKSSVEKVEDEVVEEFDDKYYVEYKEEVDSSEESGAIDEDIVYDEVEEEIDTTAEEPEEDTEGDTSKEESENSESVSASNEADEIKEEESSKKYEGSETNTLQNEFTYDVVEDLIEEDEDANVYTTGNDKKKEETKKTEETVEEKIDEVENKEGAALYGKVKIKEVLIKNNENTFDSDAWITTRDDADYYLSPISDVVIEDENKNKKVVQVAIKWVEDFDREEVKSIMDNEQKHDFKLKYKIDKNELKEEVKKAIENKEVYDYESRKTLDAFMDEETSNVLRGEIRNVGLSELGEEGKLDGSKIKEEDEDEIIDDEQVEYGKEEIKIENMSKDIERVEAIYKEKYGSESEEKEIESEEENENDFEYDNDNKKEVLENNEEEYKPYTVEDAEKNLKKFIRNKNTLKKAVEIEKDSYINYDAKIEDEVIEDEEVFYGSENGNNKNEISFDDEYDEVEAEMNVKYYAGGHKHKMCGATGGCKHTLFEHNFDTSQHNFSKLKNSSKIIGGGDYYLDGNFNWEKTYVAQFMKLGGKIETKNINLYICMNGKSVSNFFLFGPEDGGGNKLLLINCSTTNTSYVSGPKSGLTNFNILEMYAYDRDIHLSGSEAKVSNYYPNYQNSAGYVLSKGNYVNLYNVYADVYSITQTSKKSQQTCLEKVTIKGKTIMWRYVNARVLKMKDVTVKEAGTWRDTAMFDCENVEIYGNVKIEKCLTRDIFYCENFRIASNAVLDAIENELRSVITIRGEATLFYESTINIINNALYDYYYERDSISGAIRVEKNGKIIDDGARVHIKDSREINSYNEKREGIGIYSQNCNGFIYPTKDWINGVWEAPNVIFSSNDGTGVIYKNYTKTHIQNIFSASQKRHKDLIVVVQGSDIVISKNRYVIRYNNGVVPYGLEIKDTTVKETSAQVGVDIKMEAMFIPVSDREIGYDNTSKMYYTSREGDNFYLAGYTAVKNGTIVQYEIGKTYKSLTNERGKTIDLYAVWGEKNHEHVACGKGYNEAYGAAGFTGCERHQGYDLLEEDHMFFSKNLHIDNDMVRRYNVHKDVIQYENFTGDVSFNGNNVKAVKLVKNESKLNIFNIEKGQTLYVCLNGYNLSGVTFKGEGKVYITNCQAKAVTLEQGNSDYLFDGVNAEIYTDAKSYSWFTVKTKGIVNNADLIAYKVNFVPKNDTEMEKSVISANTLLLNYVTIKGYKTKDTFMNTKKFQTYNDVEISNNKQTGKNVEKRGFINIEEEESIIARSGVGTLKISQNEMEQIEGVADQYILNVKKYFSIRGHLEIKNNKITNVTSENKNLMALRIEEEGKIGSGYDRIIWTHRVNASYVWRQEGAPFAKTSIDISGNVADGGHNMYQVYSYNDKGFLVIGRGDMLEVAKSKMDVAFATEEGFGYITSIDKISSKYGRTPENSTWDSLTVDEPEKYNKVFTASKIKTSDMTVQKVDKRIRIWAGHYHKACGAEGDCKHTSYAAHPEGKKYSEYKDGNNGYYYLSSDLKDKTISVNETLSICLNGHKMTNVEFTGSGSVYVTTCKTADDVEVLDNVRFTGNRLKSYIGGNGRMLYNVGQTIKTEGQGEIHLTKVKLVKKDGVENINSIIDSTGEVVLNNVEVSGHNLTDNIVKSTRDIKIYGEVKITGNKLTKGSMFELSNSDLIVSEGAKLVVDKNKITKEDAQIEQAIIKINENRKVELLGNIEITNNEFLGVNASDGTPIERGSISAIVIEETAKIEIGNSYIKIKDNKSEGESVNSYLHLSDVYSKNKDGFLVQKDNTKMKLDLMEMGVLFPAPNVGIIYNNFSSDKVEGDISKFADRFKMDKTVGEFKIMRVKDGNLEIGYDSVYVIEYKIGEPAAHDPSITYERGGETKGHTAKTDEDVKLAECKFYVEGFTFVGWSRTIDGSDGDVAADTHVPYTTETGTTVTLYAIWRQNTYEVRYAAGYGQSDKDGKKLPTGTIPAETVYSGEKVKINNNENGFSLEGFKLLTFTPPNSSGVYYDPGDEVEPLSNKDKDVIILTAMWQEIRYNVALLKGGDGSFTISGTELSPKEYRYYTKINMTNNFTAERKVFENWKLVSVKNEAGEEVEKYAGKIGTLYPSGNSNFGLIEENKVTLYFEAQWGNAPYDIVYNKGNPIDSKRVNHASEVKGSVVSQKGKMTEAVRLKTNEGGFEVEGFEFVGWSLDPNGLGDVYTETVDEEGNRVGPEVYSINEGEYKLITLYATWREVTYNIKFSSGLPDVADASMATISNVHYYDVTNEGDILPKSTYVSEGRVFSRWKVTSIEGGDKEDTADLNKFLKATSVRGKLTTSNGATVTLTADWILRSEAHTHKACGISNGATCLHIGTSHPDDNNIYEIWDSVDNATMETIAHGGNYYLVDDLTVNNEIALESDIKLNICLNGRKLVGARFTGSGEINITNCITDSNLNEASLIENTENGELNMFNRLAVNVLGYGKIKIEANKKINGIFYDTQKTEVYNAEINVKVNYIAEWRSNSAINVFDKVDIVNCEANAYMFEDGALTIKDLTIDNSKSDTYLFYNVELTADGENNITNNETIAAIMELNTLNLLSGSKMKILNNDASNRNRSAELENGLIKTKDFSIGENAEIEVVKNKALKMIMYISGSETFAEGSVVKINDNFIETVLSVTYRDIFALSFGENKEVDMLGSIEIKNNTFSAYNDCGAAAYYIPQGSILKIGNGYINVSGNKYIGGVKKVVQVAVVDSNAFLIPKGDGYKFDAGNSNMTVAFVNRSDGESNETGVIFKNFTAEYVKDYDATLYTKAFKADTSYHDNVLLKVDVVGETNDVVINASDGYTINYKKGRAIKENRGTVEIEGEEFSVDIKYGATVEKLANNPFWANGFTFAGWTTVEGGKYGTEEYSERQVLPDFTGAKIRANGRDEVNLYAVWKENEYTIVYQSGTDAVENTMENETRKFYTSRELKNCEYERTGYEPSKWEVVSIKDKYGSNINGTGVSVGTVFDLTQVVKELARGDGSIITLKVLWVEVDTPETHMHKICGTLNNMSCNHQGIQSHNSDTTEYTVWKSSTANPPVYEGTGYYFLGNNITANRSIEVNGKLVICLNGYSLSNIRFTGDSADEVIITNCKTSTNVSITNTQVDASMFTGLNVSVYAKGFTTVKTNKVMTGSNLTILNSTFTPYDATQVIGGDIIELSNGTMNLVSSVVKGYNSQSDFMSFNNVTGKAIDTKVGDETEVIKANRILRMANGSVVTFDRLNIKNTEVERILAIESNSRVVLENENWMVDNVVSDKVVALDSTALVEAGSSNLVISGNKGAKEIVTIEAGGEWDIQEQAGVHIDDNVLRAIEGNQAIVDMKGNMYLLGTLTIQNNKVEGGNRNRIVAGLLVSESSHIYTGAGNIIVKNNESLVEDNYMYQVYSNNKAGFMRHIEGSKFKANNSEMKVAFSEPYRGVVFVNWSDDTVENFEVANGNVKRIFVADKTNDERLSTYITNSNKVDSVVIGFGDSEHVYKVSYDKGVATDLYSKEHAVTGESYTTEEMIGSSILLDDGTKYSVKGFTMAWRSVKNGETYKPGAVVNLTEFVTSDNETVEFIAEWQENKYYINYVAPNEAGITGGPMNRDTYRYYEGKQLTKSAYKKEGMTADGWVVTKVEDKNKNEITNSPLLGKKYKERENISSLTAEDGVTITLTAQFIGEVVTFDFEVTSAVDCKNVSRSPQSITVTEKRVEKTGKITFTDEGIEFEGFHLTGYKDSRNRVYELNKAYNVSEFVPNSDGVIMMTTIWEENIYYVEYYPGTGGQGTQMPRSEHKYFDYNSTIRANTYTPKKADLGFTDWEVEKILDANRNVISRDELPDGGIKKLVYVVANASLGRILNIHKGTICLTARFTGKHNHYVCGAHKYKNWTYNNSSCWHTRNIHSTDLRYDPWDGTTKITKGNYFLYSENETDVIYNKGTMTLTGDLNLCLNGNKIIFQNGGFVRPAGTSYTISITNCSYMSTDSPKDGDYDGYIEKKGGGSLFNEIPVTIWGTLSYVRLNGVENKNEMVVTVVGNYITINGNEETNIYGREGNTKININNIAIVGRKEDEEIEEVFEEDENDKELKNNIKNVSSLIDKLK